VNIPASVTSIGQNAFFEINANAIITISQTVLNNLGLNLTYGNEQYFYGASVTLIAPAST